MTNLILTDADGVLLNWEDTFKQWMRRHGFEMKQKNAFCSHGIDPAVMYGISDEETSRYIRMFNDSANIGWLPPYKDAIKYVKKLHEEHGYIFHVITSFTDDLYAYELRKKNLANLFGPTAVQKMVILGIGESKEQSLSDYKDSGLIFIEDRASNADLGIELGLESIMMMQNYNEGYCGDALMVDNWKEIYHYITEGELPRREKDLLRETIG